MIDNGNKYTCTKPLPPPPPPPPPKPVIKSKPILTLPTVNMTSFSYLFGNNMNITTHKSNPSRKLYNYIPSVKSPTVPSWFDTNGLGATYQITDPTGMTVYYMGTMCGGKDKENGQCDMCLAPGCYLYRVDGVFDPEGKMVKWDFLGRTGGIQSQLEFCCDVDMNCKPKKLTTIEEICEDKEEDDDSETIATCSGTFELGGMTASMLSDADEVAIRQAIHKEFSDASISKDGKGVVEISKLSWTSIPVTPTKTGRSLSNGAPITSVSFEVKVVSERYGIRNVGKEKNELDVLKENMKEYLSKSMSMGIFVSKLVSVAREKKSINLETVSFARLVELNVFHEIVINKEVSSIANVIVTVGALIGVIFGVMIIRSSLVLKNSDGYESVLAVSRHDELPIKRMDGYESVLAVSQHYKSNEI